MEDLRNLFLNYDLDILSFKIMKQGEDNIIRLTVFDEKGTALKSEITIQRDALITRAVQHLCVDMDRKLKVELTVK